MVFAKTNVPQMLMLPETHNNIFGTTDNAWDPARCAGGSSGGEGALIGVGGSVLGIGTDIGGSVRIPCQFNGLVGFKPTPWRVSEEGITLPFLREDRSGMQAVKLTAGPMARCVEDLALMLKCVRARGWMDACMDGSAVARDITPAHAQTHTTGPGGSPRCGSATPSSCPSPSTSPHGCMGAARGRRSDWASSSRTGGAYV